jgi:hypothetical protein
MFRLRTNGRLVGENLTAAQTHLLVGNVLERIALPNNVRAERHEISAPENLEPLQGQAFARGRFFGLSADGVHSGDDLLGLRPGVVWAKAVWRLDFEIAKLPKATGAEARCGPVQN